MVKGDASISILSVGLVIVGAVIIYAIFHPVLKPQLEEYTKTDIYVMKNAIDSSKLYLQTSLDYSVYQAMYDVAKNGGLGKSAANQWDSVLGENEFVSNVKAEILKNMNSYTSKGYMFLDLPLVYLPEYEEKNNELSESDSDVKILLSGTKLRITKKDEQEVIVLESSSDMEKVYEIDLFGMYRKAKDVFGPVKSTSCDVVGDQTKEEDGFEINQKVLSKSGSGPTCRADVKVSITEENPKEFPVFNGTGVSFEPVTFEYLVGIT
jgi:hypothetical protein